MSEEKKQRTITQNAALHVYFDDLATVLNEAGLDMRKTLKAEINISWSKESIKEYLFKPIMKLMTVKKSTTELTTDEVTKLYDILNNNLGTKFGIYVPFPTKQELEARKIFKIKSETSQQDK